MTETERKHQEDLRHLDNLRPMDDEFMRCLFKDNIPLAQLVLRIDAISRSLDHSPSDTAFRSIQGRARDETGNGLPDEYWQKADTSPPGRVRDIIYLQLIGRQHTSIQGRIWGNATRKKYVSFRSALELIYLLSEAV